MDRTFARALSSAITLVALVAVGACSSGPTRVESDLGVEDAPDWVNEGNQALTSEQGRLVHGMGVAPAMDSDSLQKSTADDRARAEVARVLSSFMEVAMQDYTASTGADESEISEQRISRQIDAVTRQNLSGAEIIARWRDPETDKLYSLAELDLQQFQESLGASKQLNDGLRDHLQSNGGNIFDRMAEEDAR